MTWFAFPAQRGELVNPKGRAEVFAIPPAAVEITQAQFEQLKAHPRSLILDGDGVVREPTEADKRPVALRRKLRELEAERRTREADGMRYTFPDGQTGTVQLTDVRDMVNITGIGATATVRARRNLTDTAQISDQEGHRHTLSPTEAEDLGLAVSAHVQSIYDAAWAHYDAIMAQATAADVEAYDVTAGHWP